MLTTMLMAGRNESQVPSLRRLWREVVEAREGVLRSSQVCRLALSRLPTVFAIAADVIESESGSSRLYAHERCGL